MGVEVEGGTTKRQLARVDVDDCAFFLESRVGDRCARSGLVRYVPCLGNSVVPVFLRSGSWECELSTFNFRARRHPALTRLAKTANRIDELANRWLSVSSAIYPFNSWQSGSVACCRLLSPSVSHRMRLYPTAGTTCPWAVGNTCDWRVVFAK